MSPPNPPFVDEVLRKVGRNLVIYQQIERALRTLAVYDSFEGTVSELPGQLEEQQVKLSNKSLGVVAGAAMKAMFTDAQQAVSTPVTADAANTILAFALQPAPETVQTIQAQIDDVLRCRNQLAHQLLERWTMLSESSSRQISAELDVQREVAVALLRRLQQLLKALAEGNRLYAEALAPEGPLSVAMEQAWLRQSPLGQLLEELPSTQARPDGWTNLAIAGKVLRARAPQEMNRLREAYGVKSLLALVNQIGAFEVLAEPTAGGGVRHLYRVAKQNGQE